VEPFHRHGLSANIESGDEDDTVEFVASQGPRGLHRTSQAVYLGADDQRVLTIPSRRSSTLTINCQATATN